VSKYEERLRSMMRGLVDEGHMTPMAVRQIERVMRAEREYGTALLLSASEDVFMDPHPHSGGEAAARAVIGEKRGGWEVVPIWRHPYTDWEVAHDLYPPPPP
jgi:hypothetical protein